MDEVNLLPWREYKMLYERDLMRRYLWFVVLFAFLILASCHVCFAVLNARHERHLAELQSLLPDEKAFPEADVLTVAALTPDIFSELSATRAHGVCYSKLEYVDQQITLVGRAQAYTGLFQAIRQLEQGGEFGNPHLINGKQEKPGGFLQFVINTGEW
jgi:hypothetical protein